MELICSVSQKKICGPGEFLGADAIRLHVKFREQMCGGKYGLQTDQDWVGSQTGGVEAETEAMMVIGSRDRSQSQWLPF